MLNPFVVINIFANHILLRSRLDLRPQGEKGTIDGTDGQPQLAPPLAADWNENDENAGPSRERRRSRLLDFHRLRQASVEERIEILRRHRSQQQQDTSVSNEGDPEERSRRAKLTDRLREKFRIRTRTQSAASGEMTSSST